MFWRGTNRGSRAAMGADAHTAERWGSVDSTTGLLRVQPKGPTLAPEELGGLLGEVRRRHTDLASQEVVFDLSRVEMIGPQWTLALAFLIDFARHIATRCRVVSLHGQPAAVMELYRCNRDVASLVGRVANG